MNKYILAISYIKKFKLHVLSKRILQNTIKKGSSKKSLYYQINDEKYFHFKVK